MDLSVEKLKSVFRDNLKKQRAEVTAEAAQEAANHLWDQLKEHPYFQKAKRIGAFSSIGSEISTLPMLEGILRSGKELYLPRTEKGQQLIQFHPVTDLSTLKPGLFNIPQPPAKMAIAPTHIDLLLVPGLAFDNRGHRLGYGNGYYDRFMKVISPDCFTLGIAYSFQIIDKTPNADHDIPVKAVLTEKFILLS
jgi:5-formyltetrahydrofolate cyclo-ligase